MPTEIPQELLDEMIHMNDTQFDYFDKKFRDNLGVKTEYERQYYNQLQGYIIYNKTFKENERPLKPHEHSAVLDQELLAEARTINLDNAKNDNKKPIQQLENPTPPKAADSIKAVTANLFAALKYEALEKEWETQLTNPANDPHSPGKDDIELDL